MGRVLGIDPGLRLTGYGLVDEPPMGTAPCAKPTLVEAGVIRLDEKHPLELRLHQLYRDLTELIEEMQPDCMAVEVLYSHYNHPRTAILMAHARGVILLTAQERALPVAHLPSTQIKKALTGYGRASKHQIQRAVQSEFDLAEPPSPPDVADAIAIALTHIRRSMIEQMV